MTKKEFTQYIQEIQRYYGYELNETEMNIWYENLKFMTIERFNYIIAEIYKVNKFMPKLSEILDMHRQIPYTQATQQKEVSGHCKKCGDTGYVIYTKIIQNMPYKYTTVCDCGRQNRYDGRKIADEKHRSDYYIPTVSEIGLDIKDNKPTKQQIYDSMMKLKDSPILPESIRNIIRQEFIKMRS
jgi:DNA-directed RNA polymerase subunit M/transcription elongation factor TFIIS